MYCKSKFDNRPANKGYSLVALAFSVGMTSMAFAQTVTAVSGPGSRVNLTPHVAVSAFVVSEADSAQAALQNTVVSAAESKVIVAVATKVLPIPIIGALPVEGLMHVLGKIKKPVVKGFQMDYIQGLASETVVQRGATGFAVPALGLQGASPLLLRLRPSTKDSMRIVRSLHVTYKMTDSQVNPATMKVLGTDQETIPCHLETGAGGDIVLIPNLPLASGEYAIVLAPNGPSAANAPVGVVWDFRIE